VDRYIKPSDLTEEELSYLRKEGKLQLLNLLDPFLINIRGFSMTNPFNKGRLRWTANAGHVLTSFGHTIDANVLLQQSRVNLLFVAHAYANSDRYFPGIELQLHEYPAQIFGRAVTMSPRGLLWLQPEGQRFRTTASQVGGLVSLKIRQRTRKRLGAYVEVSAKSAGWVAGEVELGSNVSVRLGASIAIH
jgi:hypothetical protein